MGKMNTIIIPDTASTVLILIRVAPISTVATAPVFSTSRISGVDFSSGARSRSWSRGGSWGRRCSGRDHWRIRIWYAGVARSVQPAVIYETTLAAPRLRCAVRVATAIDKTLTGYELACIQ